MPCNQDQKCRQTRKEGWDDRKQAHIFPCALFTHDTTANLNWINGEATSLWKISIVFVLPAWRQATVTAFILPIKLGEFECDERGLRLAREEGDGAQCARALPAVPASESHYGWASQLYGGVGWVCVCVWVCLCVSEWYPTPLLTLIALNKNLCHLS